MVLNLYKQNLENPSDFSLSLWGKLPKKISDIPRILKLKNERLAQFEIDPLLKETIRKTNNKFGVLTRDTKKILDDWDYQSHIIEIGHQPLYLGGSSFIFNKISYGLGISNYLNQEDSAKSIPILFLGDHDQIQNELVITRFPQALSNKSLEFKSHNFDEHDSTPMAYLNKPTEEDFLDQCNKIRTNYNELIKYSKIKGHHRPILMERLENSLDLLYETYLQNSNMGDWIGSFWAKLFVIKNKSPLLFVKASDPNLRSLLKPYMENLLKESNRKDLIKTLNAINHQLSQKNLKPGLSIRDSNYSPFFYECQQCEFKNRIKLSVTNSKLEGICSVCNTDISINYDSNNPDLSDHFKFLSPRVESRSIIFNQLINTSVRITGGGETSYHAQILPYIINKNLNVPLIIKHPRVYYNTPWSEKTSTLINFDNLKILQTSESFQRMVKIAKASNFEDLSTLIDENKKNLDETLKLLNNQETFYKNSLLKQKNKTYQRKLDLVQLYLSQTFGKYEKKKSIQEVSWNWIDLGILTGLSDIVGFYNRRIKGEMPINSTFWLSAGQFN